MPNCASPICGPSGSGKTYTLLKLATELGGPIALVDTERGSASKYADLFDFDVLELDSYDPVQLIEIINHAVANHYRVLCIDSLSHFWMGKDGELEKVDHAARRMQNPNSFAAWKQVTPLHNALIVALTTSVMNGFNAAITLSIGATPQGVTAKFAPATLSSPGNGTSTLTVSVAPGTAAGVGILTVTATGGGLTKTQTISLTY